MSSTWRIAGLVLLVGCIVLIVWAPDQVSEVLHNVFALSNVLIFVFAVAVLAWFFYAVILRKLLRARRLANARMKRMMREAGEHRGQNDL
jgi:uncharacterized protein YacL